MSDAANEETRNWKQAVFGLNAWQGYIILTIGAICSGLGALFFAVMEHLSDGVMRDIGTSLRGWAFIICPGMLALIIWLRDKYFIGTDGTGIPQTIAALQVGESEERNSCLSMRIAFGKMLLTTLGLFSFFSMGREGPSVQLGACFMNLLNRFYRFPAHLVERGLILGGGAAGIAAAFNAPIAGIVFSMEEIGRSFDKRSMSTLVRTVIIACVVCTIGLGNYYFYGEIDQGREPLQFTEVLQWATVFIIAIIGGLLGGLFSKILLWFMPKATYMLKHYKIPTAIVIGLLIALVALLSSGTTMGSGYSEARAVILNGSPEYVATLDLHEQTRLAADYDSVSPLYPLQRALASFLILITAIPGGLFDPSFSVGAGLGKLIAPFLSWTGASEQAMVLLFIVSYFSGLVQSPMTAFIIMLEMTGVTLFALPLGLAAFIAYECSRLVCPTALYESLAENFMARKAIQPDAPDDADKSTA